MLFTNVWLTAGVNKLPGQTDYVFDTVSSYINGTSKQLKYLNYSYVMLSRKMVQDLSGIGEDFVVPILNKFEKEIEMPYGKIKRLRYRVKDLVEKPDTAFNKIIRQVDYLKSTPSEISKEIQKSYNNMKFEIKNFKNCSIDPNCLVLSESLEYIELADDVLTNMFPGGKDIENSLGEVVAQMKTVKSQLGSYRDAMEQVLQYEGMADRVKTQVLSHVEKAAKTAVDMIVELDKSVKSGFDQIPMEAIDGFSVNEILKYSNEILENVVSYDGIRNALTMTCFAVMLIIVFSNGCGFSGGVIGYDRNISPVERSCCSHYGGLSLLFSVVFGVTFSWMIMMLTALDFTIGGLTERYVCQAITPVDTEHRGVDFIDRTVVNGMMGVNIDEMLNKSGIKTTKSITTENILQSCRTGKSIFRILELDDAEKNPDFQFALDLDAQILNLRGGISNSEEISNIVRDTTGQFTKYSSLINKKLDEIVNYLQDVPFGNYSQTIDNYQKQIQDTLILPETTANGTTSFEDMIALFLSPEFDVPPMKLLKTFKAALPKLKTNSNSVNQALQKTIDTFDAIQNRPTQIVESLSVIKSSVKSLARTLTDKKKGILGDLLVIQTRLNQIFNRLNGTEDGWSMTEDIVYRIRAKSDELIDRAEEYATWAHSAVLNDLGECRHVWDAYESTTELLCGNIVAGLNSHWYALGVCSFLLPFCLIFGIRLSKFYRRMQIEDKYDDVNYGRTNGANKRVNSKPDNTPYGAMFGQPVSRTNPHYGRNGARRVEDVP